MNSRGIDSVVAMPHTADVADSKRSRTYLMISVSPEYKENVARAAEAEGLTTSSLVRRLLALHLRSDGDGGEAGK